jgi:two-component system, NtrC family, nitrogen regulation sensor histidine kinase NtrY
MLKNALYLLLAVVLLGLVYGYDYLVSETADMRGYAREVENRIEQYDADITAMFEDEKLVKRLILHDFDGKKDIDVEALFNQPYSVFVYKKPDSLVFWSNNRILPFSAEVEFPTKPIRRYSTIENSGYVSIIYPFAYGGETYSLVGLIPVVYNYSIQNEYLKNGIAVSDKIPPSVTVQFKPTDFPVTVRGDVLFFLNSDGPAVGRGHQYLLLFLYLVSLVILFRGLHQFAKLILYEKGNWLAFGFLVGSTFAVLWLLNFLDFPALWTNISLFEYNPLQVQGSQISSIGDFLVRAIIGLWLMVFAYQRLTMPSFLVSNTAYHLPTVIAAHSIIVLSIIVTAESFRRLVVFSDINFDIETLYRLKNFSFVGTLALSIILLTLFIFIVKIKDSIKDFEVSNRSRLLINLVFCVVGGVLWAVGYIGFIGVFILFFAVLVLQLVRRFVLAEKIDFLWLVTWITVFSVFAAVLFYQFNEQKELKNRILFATNISLERDTFVEKSFDNVVAGIVQDHFIKRISNPFFPRNKIIEQINEAHLKRIFSDKYAISIHLYSPDTLGTKNESTPYTYFADFINQGVLVNRNTAKLHFWSNQSTERRYIAEIPILADNRRYYTIIIELLPRTIGQLRDYPSVLLDNSFALRKRFNEYDYAIYRNGRQVQSIDNTQSKTFNDSLYLEQDAVFKKEDKSYLVHRTDDGRVVLVSKKMENWGSIFSVFSYMFCLFLIVNSLLLVLGRVRKKPFLSGVLRLSLAPSLRGKIQNNVILVVILTFIGIGVTTIFYFQSEAKEYHSGRLERKVKAVEETVKYIMETESSRDSFYLPDIFAISKIHDLDVNLYDYDGVIVAASREEVFTKSLLSPRMNPISHHRIYTLNREIDYRIERIGDLTFSVAYLPVYRFGKNIAHIGLPYYAEIENSRKDIGAFLGRLLNVYVLIFIFAGVATYFLTNKITNPLDQLGRQMQNVSLGKRNEPLNWKGSDEIGVLIEQYNEMLKALERSADLLAKSEREGAWREMAKQVAHEIKNPLTPMKLQIQFLQRAYQSRPEDIGPLLKRTAYTLVEQIDGLTRIASDFSNFAKMPVANNEVFMLNKVVESVVELFSQEEQITFQTIIPDETLEVFADKDQIIRVLNNIIKNAIQAITLTPEYNENGKIVITLEKRKNVAQISIADNGSGISEEQKSKIFVPNFTTKSSGTGLGLAMSKNIVDALGGRIFFETELNKGTTFFVEIPIWVEGKE